MSATTRFTDPTLPEPPALYLALELSNRSWKLAFSTGHGPEAPASATFQLETSPPLPARSLSLAHASSCPTPCPSSPASRRAETASGSIAFFRRSPTASTSSSSPPRSRSTDASDASRPDRIDAHKLLTMLIRYHNGESRVWSVVHVPTPEAEGRPPPSPRAPHSQGRPNSHHQPHQGPPRCPGPLPLFPQSWLPRPTRRPAPLRRLSASSPTPPASRT